MSFTGIPTISGETGGLSDGFIKSEEQHTIESKSEVAKGVFSGYKKTVNDWITHPMVRMVGGDPSNDAFKIDEIVAYGVPLALIAAATAGGIIGTRRSRKSKMMKRMSNNIESGISTLKTLSSLGSLGFGKKRRSHKRKTHRRRSHKR